MQAEAGQLAGKAVRAGDGVAGDFLAGFGVEDQSGAVVGDQEAVVLERNGRFRPPLISTAELARLLVVSVPDEHPSRPSLGNIRGSEEIVVPKAGRVTE